MIQLFGTGEHRVFYRAAAFQTGLTVTGYLWSPTLDKSALQTLTEIEEGLYYLDYDFASVGGWPAIFMEGGVKQGFETIRVEAGIADAVDTELTSEHGAGSWQQAGAGTGGITFVYTLTSSGDGPIADAWVGAYTDVAMTNLVASGYTDDFGKITFYLDAGTYYLKRAKSGWDFTNPDTEVVS